MADDAKYDNLRDNLNESLASLSDAQLENRLAMAGMDAEAMEGFFDDLGKFAAKAAPSILPIYEGLRRPAGLRSRRSSLSTAAERSSRQRSRGCRSRSRRTRHGVDAGGVR